MWGKGLSVLGLLGSGFCFLAFLGEGFYADMAGMLTIVLPFLLFFAESIWVCKALLDRLKGRAGWREAVD